MGGGFKTSAHVFRRVARRLDQIFVTFAAHISQVQLNFLPHFDIGTFVLFGQIRKEALCV